MFFPLSALKLTVASRRREKPSPHPAEPWMDELNNFYSSTQPKFTCNTVRSSESTTIAHLGILFAWSRTGSMVKHPPANAGDLGSIPGSRRFSGKGNGHSSVLAWEIQWIEEPGELQSKGSQQSGTQLSESD